MTAGTVVITGGILATVILLLIIAVLCYCRLQVRPQLLSVSVAFCEFPLNDCRASRKGLQHFVDGHRMVLNNNKYGCFNL